MGLVFGWLARRLGWVRDVDFGAREGVAGTIRKGGGVSPVYLGFIFDFNFSFNI